MNDIQITEAGVKSLLANLNAHSSHGPDGISNQVLKRCAAHIAPFLVVLFTLSFKLRNVAQRLENSERHTPT